MAEYRASQHSLVSKLGDETNYDPHQSSYELQSIHGSSIIDASPSSYYVDQEGRGLLDEHGPQRSQGHGASKSSFNVTQTRLGSSGRSAGFFETYNPITIAGRREISRAIKRSGPVNKPNQDIEADTSSSRTHGKPRFQGWRMGVLVSIIAVSICLVVELIMLAVAMAHNKPQGDRDSIGVVFVGECSKVDRMNTLLAIPINIIATVLMATSNYVMQCLSAPSRKEVDEAHAARSYLNIGVSSVHNLFHNPSWKSVLWLSLVVTTIPIHLLLNSAFFAALQANNYGVMIANEGWNDDLHSTYQNYQIFFNSSSNSRFYWPLEGGFTALMYERWEAASLVRLTPDECFARYRNPLQSVASNVVLVTTKDTGKYTPTPPLSAAYYEKYFENVMSGGSFDGAIPNTIFELPENIGLYLNPYTGNAQLMFNNTGYWTSAIRTSNSSGGIYLQKYQPDGQTDYQSDLYDMPTVRSIFSSFDFHFWTTVKERKYDFNNSDILQAGQWNPSSWMCTTEEILSGKSCTGATRAPQPWLVTPEEFEIDHCLSQETSEKCSLQYSFHILIIVIVCDVLKIAAMAATLWLVKENPLATLGDAVASFMERNDPHTGSYCLLQQKQARKACRTTLWTRIYQTFSPTYRYNEANPLFAGKLEAEVNIWKDTVTHWYSAPSLSRWSAFGILYIGLFVASLLVLFLGIRDLRDLGITTPFSLGFGTIDANAIFTYPATFSADAFNGTSTVVQTNKPQSLFANVVTVNTPQLLFSTLYFMYNGMFTCMVTAAEWSRFARTPRTLRVSDPRPGQRSTYWLQLPWKYSLPLLSISVLLHWLVSRSLFIVRITVFGWDGAEQEDRNILACGYSPLAILVVILVISLSLVVMLIAGWQKLTPGIPVCGTNSLAIAAACHSVRFDGQGEEDKDVVCRPLLWGVTSPAEKGRPGHCCITDQDNVSRPVDGMEYR